MYLQNTFIDLLSTFWRVEWCLSNNILYKVDTRHTIIDQIRPFALQDRHNRTIYEPKQKKWGQMEKTIFFYAWTKNVA